MESVGSSNSLPACELQSSSHTAASLLQEWNQWAPLPAQVSTACYARLLGHVHLQTLQAWMGRADSYCLFAAACLLWTEKYLQHGSLQH